jgi:hypothetical protein
LASPFSWWPKKIFPYPSEIIMPLAGFVAARGQLTLIGIVLAVRLDRLPEHFSGMEWADGSALSV